MKHFSKSRFCVLLVVLLAAAAMTGCPPSTADTGSSKGEASVNTADSKSAASSTQASAETGAPSEAPADSSTTTTTTTAAAGQPVDLGEGEKLFYFNVTFSSGETSSYAIHTDAETVGEALVALKLISGDDSQYGLYVKTVADETLDYEADGAYWAFYEGTTYATSGVDATAITDGASYAFVATKS